MKIFSLSQPATSFRLITSIMTNSVDQVRIHSVLGDMDDSSEEVTGSDQFDLWDTIHETMVLDRVTKMPSVKKISWLSAGAAVIAVMIFAVLAKKGYCACLSPCCTPCTAVYR